VSGGSKERGSRESRERARVYQARLAFHEGTKRRRTRDNLIAGIGGGLLILAIIGAQTVYFTSGPGAPTPAPSVTSTPIPTPTPSPSGSPTPTPTPSTTP
jgi:hypothetical protein